MTSELVLFNTSSGLCEYQELMRKRERGSWYTPAKENWQRLDSETGRHCPVWSGVLKYFVFSDLLDGLTVLVNATGGCPALVSPPGAPTIWQQSYENK